MCNILHICNIFLIKKNIILSSHYYIILLRNTTTITTTNTTKYHVVHTCSVLHIKLPRKNTDEVHNNKGKFVN